VTHSGGKPHAVGDRGQRYEIWCKNGDGHDMCVGYSNNPGAFKNMVDLHPVWHSRRVVDRQPSPPH
jgi:hypothetical protein